MSGGNPAHDYFYVSLVFRNCRELTQSDQIIASGTLDALKSTHAGHRFEKFGLVVDSLDVFVIADF